MRTIEERAIRIFRRKDADQTANCRGIFLQADFFFRTILDNKIKWDINHVIRCFCRFDCLAVLCARKDPHCDLILRYDGLIGSDHDLFRYGRNFIRFVRFRFGTWFWLRFRSWFHRTDIFLSMISVISTSAIAAAAPGQQEHHRKARQCHPKCQSAFLKMFHFSPSCIKFQQNTPWPPFLKEYYGPF